MIRRTGLALILVVGVLGVLAVLGSAFAILSRLERRAAGQRVHASRALLLARSGVEDALARMGGGQDPFSPPCRYGGEDWDDDGAVTGLESVAETYLPGTADLQDCPVRHALRPTFFAADSLGLPLLETLDGKQRGYSGILQSRKNGLYAIRIRDLNGRIHVNGGALDALDRDPDGPAAAPECGPLTNAGSGPDHKDTTMQGPNGFLVRLLNNLDAVVTSGASSTLGVEVVGSRPKGGYRSLDELRDVLGQARYEQLKGFLTIRAWVDPKVVKPQPTDSRPRRFEDIDDTHRIGSDPPTGTIAGTAVTLPITGTGTSDLPWTATVPYSNTVEGSRTYALRWERQFLYAWRQLRLAPAPPEPRAPISLNDAPREVLASALLGLKGTYLETWDGSAGFDGGFGLSYAFPDDRGEEVPWHRARADYGKEYGASFTYGWYGGADYDPTFDYQPLGDKGKPLPWSAPLGRLKETPPLTLTQALAVADQVRRRVCEGGPFRTWTELNAFVDALPLWEDVNGNGVLDGTPYTTILTTRSRRKYEREDANSDGVMNRRIFEIASGSWASGSPAWTDLGAAALGAGQVPGLTRFQKDLVKAMANPNTDLNDFNPDESLWKDLDKTDVCGFLRPSAPWTADDPANAYVHTTEFLLGLPICTEIDAAGRWSADDGKGLARRQLRASASAGVYRDTTQADFMRGYAPPGQPVSTVFSEDPAGLGAPYPLAGGQPLVSLPEPQSNAAVTVSWAKADYDGQIALGYVGSQSAPALPSETIRGDLFNTARALATNDAAVADNPFRGPFLNPLVVSAAASSASVGSIFPDGVYSEKNMALKYPVVDAATSTSNVDQSFYVGFWVKPNWLPEASPRPHSLASLSRGYATTGVPLNRVPIDDIDVYLSGLYFAPGRNNYTQGIAPVYSHAGTNTGRSWPCRSLLFGNMHGFFMTDCLAYRGVLNTQSGAAWSVKDNPLPAVANPVGRLQGHRWVHLAVMQARNDANFGMLDHTLMVGRYRGSTNGGGWAYMTLGSATGGYHQSDSSPNHLRLGETSAMHVMNYTADATFAGIRVGTRGDANGVADYEAFFSGTSGPPILGRYYKEHGARYTSPRLPAGLRPVRITWTEIPCDPWFDAAGNDGWMDALLQDRDGNGKRDVRIDLEVWDDAGTASSSDDVLIARCSDPGARNLLRKPQGRLYYKAVFVNEWSAAVRSNHPLDVTPYLDDVTLTHQNAGMGIWAFESVTE